MGEHFSRLSIELLSHADSLERGLLEDLNQEERKEYSDGQLLVDKVVRALIEARERIHSRDFAVFEQLARENRELIDSLLDNHYTLAGLQNVSSLVNRTMLLAQLQSSNAPSSQTNRYVQEAARAYINGLPLASVAMSRAALEQGLKDRLGRQGDGVHIEFRELLDEAKKSGLLADQRAARKLAKECNDLLHEKPVSDSKAFEIFAAIRSLLEEIYSAQGGY